MNKTFHARRFGRLFLKHTTEHYKSYLMSLCVLAGVMLLGGSFLVYLVEFPLDKNFQEGMFLIILLLAGAIFTSTIFSELVDRKRSIPWLLLPASHFEKFLVAWIWSFALFLVLYIITFYGVALLVLNIRHFPDHPTEIFNAFDHHFWQIYLIYAFLHGIALCGALYFEKLNFIKTGFFFFICLGILVFFNKVILGILLNRTIEIAPPFGSIRIKENDQFYQIYIAGKQQDYYQMSVVVILAFILWAAAYHRLKEKQV